MGSDHLTHLHTAALIHSRIKLLHQQLLVGQLERAHQVEVVRRLQEGAELKTMMVSLRY